MKLRRYVPSIPQIEKYKNTTILRSLLVEFTIEFTVIYVVSCDERTYGNK